MKKISIVSLLLLTSLFAACEVEQKPEAEVKTSETTSTTTETKIDTKEETSTANDDVVVTEIIPIEVDRSSIEAKEGTVKESGSVVTLDYVGKKEDGTIFDTSKLDNREPLTFITGQNSTIPGFEKNVVGMKTGESKSFTVKAEDAYESDESRIQEVPAIILRPYQEAGLELKAGAVLPSLQGPIVLKEIKDGGETVVLDLNGELADKDLNFEVTVLSVIDQAEIEANMNEMNDEEQTDVNTDDNQEVKEEDLPVEIEGDIEPVEEAKAE